MLYMAILLKHQSVQMYIPFVILQPLSHVSKVLFQARPEG